MKWTKRIGKDDKITRRGSAVNIANFVIGTDESASNLVGGLWPVCVTDGIVRVLWDNFSDREEIGVVWGVLSSRLFIF